MAWDWGTVGWAIVALGAGVLAATAATRFIGGAVGGWVAQLALWVAMIVPVLLAFRASVPRGLLTWRWLDLLYGVTLGLMLRVVAGWLEQAATGTAPWPAYPTTDGSLPPDWWAVDLLVPVVIAPAVEEFFFRGMLLVALYTVFRRLTRIRLVAGIGAALISTGLFLLLHQLTGSLAPTWDGAATLTLVGLTAATLVLLTGRLWSALILHTVFNGTYVALALAGTLLGVSAAAPTLG